MKLRIRRQWQTAAVELLGAEPTLGDLRAHLCQSLLPSWGYSSDSKFAITLNNRDPLVGDEESLASFGIVSGDLIHLLLEDADAAQRLCSPSLSTPQPQNEPSTSAVCQSQPRIQDNGIHSGHIVDHTVQGDIQMSDNMAGSSQEFVSATVSDDLDLPEAVGSYPSEPMLCCEATDGQVPHSLETLYHAAECSSGSDALIVVIHLIMMETGYIPQGTEAKATLMPKEWRNKGIYKLQYTHPLCENGFAALTCVPLGDLIVVNAMLKIAGDIKSVKRLQLLPASFISFQNSANVAEVYKDLQKLSRLFKDRLVYPLLAAARQALNLPDVFGLVVLPLELKLRILRLLDVRSLLSLSAVCRDLYTASNDQLLWRFTYLRDFRDSVARSRDTDWKELYKKKWKQKKDALKWRHMPFALPPPPRPLYPNPLYPIPFTPIPFPPNPLHPPGIIGGEFEERATPPFIGDPIHSLFPASIELPGQYPPLGPHFDPFVPFQDLNPRLPARATRGRAIESRRAFI